MAAAGGEDDDGEQGITRLITRSRLHSQTPETMKESQWKLERSNLLNISNLCIKNLIESALLVGSVVDESHEPFQQLFVVLENVLRHGLKMKRNILGQRRDYWAPLEMLERVSPHSAELVISVRNLPGIKTNHGKGRAWIRLALMQKKLADYIQDMVDQKLIMSEWYDSHAILMQEEGVVIGGLLVGLNVIDCNFDLKGDKLDMWSAVLNLSLYLKDGNYLEKTTETNGKKMNKADGGLTDFTVLIDQKTYLEEINKNLSSNVADLQMKVKRLEETNKDQSSQISEFHDELSQVTGERDKLREQTAHMDEVSVRKVKLAQADIDVERKTYQKSREGLNEMCIATQKQLETEMELRKVTEKELQLTRVMKEENEVAMRFLEKDIHEKQDTLVSLRRQLQDIKNLNLELHTRLQSSENSAKEHMEKWTELEENCAKLINHTKELENRLHSTATDKANAEDMASQLNTRLTDSEHERNALATNLKIEREWRQKLQEDSHKDKERLGAMTTELKQLEQLKKEYQHMLEKHSTLKKRYAQQETALIEMGSHLSSSQQKVENMKEVTNSMKEMKWLDDKDTLHCQSCKQIFSLARRKHHCRNCGGIYCGGCSDNTMPLPSSAKPVRVCDLCHTSLLQRYQR